MHLVFIVKNVDIQSVIVYFTDIMLFLIIHTKYFIIDCYRCSQYNKNLEQNNQNQNAPTNISDHCKKCLIPWKNGNFTMKTIPKCKNSKLKKKPRTFSLVKPYCTIVN